jgi:hypothetical protein
LQLNGRAASGDRGHGFVAADRCQLVVSKVCNRHALDALRAGRVHPQLVQAELLFDGCVDCGQIRRSRHFASWQAARYGFKGRLDAAKIGCHRKGRQGFKGWLDAAEIVNGRCLG